MGERYRRLIDRWKAWLSQDARLNRGDGWGALPLVSVVAQRAWQLYQRVLCGIEQVCNETPARELHRIRIDAKRLSALIDAAASLYDADAVATVLRALKPLQSVLGELNDAYVQTSWLRRYAGALPASECNLTVRRAAEALAELTDRRGRALRKRVNQEFLRFGARSNRVAFERFISIEQPTELVQ
jgi:CHAD domain-containing protein